MLVAPGSDTGIVPAFSTTGARHGSGELLAGALDTGGLVTAALDAGALTSADPVTVVLATGERSGLAGTVDAALLPGPIDVTGGAEAAARLVGWLAQPATSRTVKATALIGVGTRSLALTAGRRNRRAIGCLEERTRCSSCA
jgi:hypothetical protein